MEEDAVIANSKIEIGRKSMERKVDAINAKIAREDIRESGEIAMENAKRCVQLKRKKIIICNMGPTILIFFTAVTGSFQICTTRLHMNCSTDKITTDNT